MLLGLFNWTDFSTDFMTWWMSAFIDPLGGAFWPLIFTTVFGVTFLISNKNLAVTTAAILMTFGIFGTYEAFVSQPEFSLFFSIIAIAGFAGTAAALFIKKPGGG